MTSKKSGDPLKTWCWTLTPEDGELLELPSPVLGLTQPAVHRAPAGAPRPAGPTSARVPEGQRNAALASVAGVLRKWGAGEDVITAALASVYETACAPGVHPLEKREVENIARSIARYPAEVVGAAPIELKAVDTGRWRAAVKADPEGYTAGFGELDRDVRFLPGSVSYVVARTGQGKTTFLANLALNIARANVAPVVFISLEVRELDLVLKLVTALQGRDGTPFDQTRSYLRGVLQNAEVGERVEAAIKELAGLPRFHPVSPSDGASAADVAAYVATARSHYGAPPVVIVDYVQLIRPGRRNADARYLELAEISHTLLDAAKINDAVVIAGCQARRSPTGVTPDARPPALADLRESGDLEQDAAVVLGLHSPLKDEKYKASVDVEVLKNRYGRAGAVVTLAFYKPQGVMEDAEAARAAGF